MKAKFIFDVLNENIFNDKLTPIEKDYADMMLDKLMNCDGEECKHWSVYNEILAELINLKKTNEVLHIKYLLTNGYDPKKVFLDELSKLDDHPYKLLQLMNKVENF